MNHSHKQGNELDWVEVDGERIDFPFEVEPEVSTHELTYPGRVDFPAGMHLGPGLDNRQVVVAGCIWDAEAEKTTVVVEAQSVPAPLVSPFVAQLSKSIADLHEATLAGLVTA